MKATTMLAAAAAVLLTGAGAYAHHSFAALYDENREIQIQGELVQFLFRNPHAWVYVMAPDENGELQRWGVEWGGVGQLISTGVTSESLQPGDRVIIRGNPARNPADYRIRMRSLWRTADAFRWGFDGEDFD